LQTKGGYVYIFSNKNRSTFYIGVTNDIKQRIYQHKFEKGSKFTYKYNVHDLLFYEFFSSIEEAIINEKKFKNNNRSWKIKIITRENPDMVDLAEDWYE